MTAIHQNTCKDCGDPIIGKRRMCPTCQDTTRRKKESERARRQYAKRKEAVEGQPQQPVVGRNPVG